MYERMYDVKTVLVPFTGGIESDNFIYQHNDRDVRNNGHIKKISRF